MRASSMPSTNSRSRATGKTYTNQIWVQEIFMNMKPGVSGSSTCAISGISMMTSTTPPAAYQSTAYAIRLTPLMSSGKDR